LANFDYQADQDNPNGRRGAPTLRSLLKK